MVNAVDVDKRMMSRALELAESGHRAHPNPRVGCVIARGGRVVGEGAHERFGGPHAEARALARAGSRARGATVYVTLEPCPHWGKTPPCADALVQAGVRRVVVAGADPLRSGKGLALLRKAGVSVQTGFMRSRSERLNEEFLTWALRRRPWVILKMAQSLDGKIASCTGASRWISGVESRAWVRLKRSHVDAVAVGGETVRRDNPRLTTRGAGPDPLRVIFSGSLDLNPRSNVFDSDAPTWVLTTPHVSSLRRRRLERVGAVLVEVPGRGRAFDVREAVKALGRRGITSLMVEGGGRTASAFLRAGVVDEVCIFVAPFFLGGADAPTPVEGAGWTRPALGPRLKSETVSRCGRDILVEGRL